MSLLIFCRIQTGSKMKGFWCQVGPADLFTFFSNSFKPLESISFKSNNTTLLFHYLSLRCKPHQSCPQLYDDSYLKEERHQIIHQRGRWSQYTVSRDYA